MSEGKLERWLIEIEDFELNRDLTLPQTVHEAYELLALTAEDALAIARVRHNAPLEEQAPSGPHTRKIVNLTPLSRQPETWWDIRRSRQVTPFSPESREPMR